MAVAARIQIHKWKPKQGLGSKASIPFFPPRLDEWNVGVNCNGGGDVDGSGACEFRTG